MGNLFYFQCVAVNLKIKWKKNRELIWSGEIINARNADE